MLLAPFLWIFCEFDEKVLDNSSLAGQKKELYAEYREVQRQMREAVAIKANIDHLLGITDERENKAQER